MTTTLAPMTRHAAVCAGCGAEAILRADCILREIVDSPYVGTATATARLDFAVPDGWRFDETLPGFLCQSCKSSGLHDGSHGSRQP